MKQGLNLAKRIVLFFLGMSIIQLGVALFLKTNIGSEIGYFIIAIGFSILSASNLGVAPNDIIPFIIQDKARIEYRWVRISLDAIFLIGGFLLGGKVGVGTIIAMLSTGPLIQLCLPHGEKCVNLILGSCETKSEEVAA